MKPGRRFVHGHSGHKFNRESGKAARRKAGPTPAQLEAQLRRRMAEEAIERCNALTRG